MFRIIAYFFRISCLILFFQFFFQSTEAQWLKDKYENWKERRAERIAVTDRYQITGPVASWTHVQDQGMSSLTYSGPGGGGFWTSYKQKPGWTELGSLWFRYNMLGGPAEALKGNITNPAAGFESVFLRKLADPRWHLGGSLTVFLSGPLL